MAPKINAINGLDFSQFRLIFKVLANKPHKQIIQGGGNWLGQNTTCSNFIQPKLKGIKSKSSPNIIARRINLISTIEFFDLKI
jgi:hypothetical protein